MPSRLYVANEHPRPSGVSRGMRLETAPARVSLAAGAARGGVAALRPLQASLVDPWSLGAIESMRLRAAPTKGHRFWEKATLSTERSSALKSQK